MQHKKEEPNKKLSTDSKTSDVSHISVHDSRLTVRINSKLKEAFLSHFRAKGLSACHICEGLFYGYLQGFYDKIDTDVKSPTIELTLVRDVKRVRRYAVEEESVSEDEDKSGMVKRELCCYCRRSRIHRYAVNRFRYLPTGQDYPLCGHHAERLLETDSWSVIKNE
jgi:hypothetical protein